MPKGRYSFGFMSYPGACAAELKIEVERAALPRIPDAVCVMAPSNDLTASRTIQEAGASFAAYLNAVCCRWPEVGSSNMYIYIYIYTHTYIDMTF